MSITVHLLTAAGVQRRIETAEVRLFVVGIFALGIGVMNDRTEAYAVTDARSATADSFVVSNRFACLAIDKTDLR